MTTSKKLTIFEGPDGGGKTTAARGYAELTGARYVHLPAFPRVGKALPRFYAEAMLPAVLGYEDVVMDRCWLSETPYGVTFREGENRVPCASARMLERLALRCGAVLVKCLPPLEVCQRTFMGRKHLEMLDDVRELTEVYQIYTELATGLPTIKYDYTALERPVTDALSRLIIDVETIRPAPHALNLRTAGRWDAPVVLVGEAFAKHKNDDPLYQWPFASFSDEGCSRWLTKQLTAAGVWEDKLLWVNADQDLRLLGLTGREKIIALGGAAQRRLDELYVPHVAAPHPQMWKRFHAGQPYQPLLDHLKEFAS